MEKLNAKELVNLVHSVFPPLPGDRRLGILVDVPHRPSEDTGEWRARREIAGGWAQALNEARCDLGLDEILLLAYPSVGSNNAQLPGFIFSADGPVPSSAGGLAAWGTRRSFDEMFAAVQLFLAPTQFSTTAPLKVAAKRFGFRAATMPGFSPAMIPALRIDYTEVNNRVLRIKTKLDQAENAHVTFQVDDRSEHHMRFDLRHRTAHASTGRFPDTGTAGNLPSGEAYIVPYEGEKGEPSLTQGELPVQIGEDLLFFDIQGNRAVSVSGEGRSLFSEREHLQREPAYGNMAELGFGVLADFGISPIGEILLDEKLGFHVAFGRSEHFGGMVGPGDFSRPEEVIHLDRIYIPATQPRIKVASILLGYPGDRNEEIMRDGRYLSLD